MATHFSQRREHPIDRLIEESAKGFDELLQRQSKDYATAHSEYRRRYGIEPPPGFKAWFEFAVAHESPIIDDFDIIHERVSPFLKLSGRDVTKIINDAHQTPGSELWLCEFFGQDVETYCTHPYRSFDRYIQHSFEQVLGQMRGGLPDIKFLVNHLDEPRVVVSSMKKSSGGSTDTSFSLKNHAKSSVWSTVTKKCALSRHANQDNYDTRAETFGLPFVTNITSHMNLCHHPEYQSMHGLFISPVSFPIIEGPVPVLSTGSPSTMGDILFPNPAYAKSEFLYDEKHDMAWEDKRRNLYWAGSTTGGVARDQRWRAYHRQRFVGLTQNLGGQKHHYLQEKNGLAGIIESPFLNGRLFDVAFTRIFQCETKFCREQKEHFNLKFWQNKDKALGSQLVFDIDGNGVSGHYYKLLASKSVPLKQTLLREWHDDRLVPWVHYIPISQSMKEVPELVTHLTSTDSGQMRAREVAEQGRAWFSKAFRDVDFTIYNYRLLLELARLQDVQRQPFK